MNNGGHSCSAGRLSWSFLGYEFEINVGASFPDTTSSLLPGNLFSTAPTQIFEVGRTIATADIENEEYTQGEEEAGDTDKHSTGLRHGQTRQLPGAPASRGAKIEKIRGAGKNKGRRKKLKGR